MPQAFLIKDSLLSGIGSESVLAFLFFWIKSALSLKLILEKSDFRFAHFTISSQAHHS